MIAILHPQRPEVPKYRKELSKMNPDFVEKAVREEMAIDDDEKRVRFPGVLAPLEGGMGMGMGAFGMA